MPEVASTLTGDTARARRNQPAAPRGGFTYPGDPFAALREDTQAINVARQQSGAAGGITPDPGPPRPAAGGGYVSNVTFDPSDRPIYPTPTTASIRQPAPLLVRGGEGVGDSSSTRPGFLDQPGAVGLGEAAPGPAGFGVGGGVGGGGAAGGGLLATVSASPGGCG